MNEIETSSAASGGGRRARNLRPTGGRMDNGIERGKRRGQTRKIKYRREHNMCRSAQRLDAALHAAAGGAAATSPMTRSGLPT